MFICLEKREDYVNIEECFNASIGDVERLKRIRFETDDEHIEDATVAYDEQHKQIKHWFPLGVRVDYEFVNKWHIVFFLGIFNFTREK